MSPIERKWWFMLPVMTVAAVATLFLLDSANVPNTNLFARSLIFGLCFASLHRGLSFCIWMGLLWGAPGLADSKLAKGKPASR
ncbi:MULTISPECIES: hypothetical protein [unclassified Janthinobacterium]|uniref:hypothetical protein n=1 Tax=unclassified Janthinobacterium TaxID=2610881 RepID=UPI001C56FF70|nr:MULTISPECIES: hypothetical protein [unclassified Janthinobacterium]QYG08801.1 hypothetical protein KY494_08655 [Janthinobacterium sp. PAMC25594]